MKTIISKKSISISLLIATLLLLPINLCKAQLSDLSNNIHPINTKLLEKQLLIELKIAFPYMEMDSALLPILHAESQTAAGSPSCYGTHYGTYINLDGNEAELAKNLVADYKAFLIKRIFLKESAIRTCRSKSFCAIAVKEDVLIHVEFIIDNGIKLEELELNKEY